MLRAEGESLETAQKIAKMAELWDSIPQKEKEDYYSDIIARELPQKYLKNSKLVTNRMAILDEFYKEKGAHTTMLEVGTRYGYYARKMHEICKPQKLHILDLDFRPGFDYDYFQQFITKGEVVLHKGNAAQIFPKDFPNKHFDFIFIDGEYSAKGYERDLKTAASKIKNNGYLVAHNYTFYDILMHKKMGLNKVINEFCINYNFEIIFFALQTWGFFTVVLKKMKSNSLLSRIFKK